MQFAFFIFKHIKRSVLYLLCQSRKLRSCFEIKLASQGLSTGLVRSRLVSEREWGRKMDGRIRREEEGGKEGSGD